MTRAAMTIVPAMSNPDAMEDVAQLRDELLRANNRIADLSTRLHDIVHVAHDLQLVFGRLIDAHEKSDDASIRATLQAASVRRASYTAALNRKH